MIGIMLVGTLHGLNAFLEAAPSKQLLLMLSGPVTAIPLLLFARAARQIPLSLPGLLQYMTTTLQLLTGVLIYHEAFDGTRLTGFMVIWTALAVYSLKGYGGCGLIKLTSAVWRAPDGG